ncbi:MAG: alpha/beta hydrolase [Gemmataceae bacterium]|nr:alpha/beta hydrolase [Gemmataceae bacterium]
MYCRIFRAIGFAMFLLLFLSPMAISQDVRIRDVIYGRKFGLSMTMDIFKPAGKPNHAAVVFVVSGGWFSSVDSIRPIWCKVFTDRGYTVFAVVHGSNPKFTIPDAIDDLHLATRYIRSKAKEFAIDPGKIGIIGGSAGGHLSLMMGVAGKPPVAGSKNPVEAFPSGANAVACFFPPTDFLNWGEKGVEQLGRGKQGIPNIVAPFDFVLLNQKKNQFEPVEDPEARRAIGRAISPMTHVTKKSAPTLIIHGDADKLVSIQQAEVFVEKMKAAGVVVELDTRKGAAHGWLGMEKDLEKFADWFDKHLLK